MNITLVGGDHCPRLIFRGSMTIGFSTVLEDGIIAAMRRYRQLEVDLSGVHEIDRSGAHFLGLLQSVGGSNVNVVAVSPAVEQASRGYLASRSRPARTGAVASASVRPASGGHAPEDFSLWKGNRMNGWMPHLRQLSPAKNKDELR